MDSTTSSGRRLLSTWWLVSLIRTNSCLCLCQQLIIIFFYPYTHPLTSGVVGMGIYICLFLSLFLYIRGEKRARYWKPASYAVFFLTVGKILIVSMLNWFFGALFCLFAWRLACSLKQPMLGPVSRRKSKGNQYVVQCPFYSFPLLTSLLFYKVANQIADVISAALRPDFFCVEVCAVLNPCNIFGRIVPP